MLHSYVVNVNVETRNSKHTLIVFLSLFFVVVVVVALTTFFFLNQEKDDENAKIDFYRESNST